MRDVKPTNLRVPTPLRERVDEYAERTHRSRQGALLFLIERGLEAEDAGAPRNVPAPTDDVQYR